MAHFGIISPPVPGHVNPFCALGRGLKAKGHQVTYFQMLDLEEKIRAEGLDFYPLGAKENPPGTLAHNVAEIGHLKGMAAMRFTVEAIRVTTEVVCRELPRAIQACGVDFLLVDQMEPSGGSVAEHLGLPYVSVCNALAINRESSIPPPFTGWGFSRNPFARVRNWLGYAASDRTLRPITELVARYREEWGLPPHRVSDDSFSPLAQISQQPRAFDFPREKLPENFHYVGPIRHPSPREIPFPWDKLDGRPVIYGSLGSLQGGNSGIFKVFAEACARSDAQLVLSHGGALDECAVAALSRQALVVSYAPQTELLTRAKLTLTHAGLNTVLDSLAAGVPLVSVPLVYEQAAIAQRVRWVGVGKVVPLSKLSVPRLRSAIECVLSDSVYVERARNIQRSIQESGGLDRSVAVIEGILQARTGARTATA